MEGRKGWGEKKEMNKQTKKRRMSQPCPCDAFGRLWKTEMVKKAVVLQFFFSVSELGFAFETVK